MAALAATSLCVAASAAAQPAPVAAAGAVPAETPAPTQAPPTGPFVPAGSPVIIELSHGVSTRTIRRGDLFPVRLASAITLDGRVIVPAGATGQGQVVEAAPSGALGKPAKLILAARYIQVDGTRLALRGFRLGAVGKDNSNAILAASFVPYVGMLALFAHGGEIEVPAGALGQAKLAADLPAPLAQAPSAPGSPAAPPPLPPAAPASTPAP